MNLTIKEKRKNRNHKKKILGAKRILVYNEVDGHILGLLIYRYFISVYYNIMNKKIEKDLIKREIS